MLLLSDFVSCRKRYYNHLTLICKNFMISRFRQKVLDLKPKSVCAVEMTMYVHWTYKHK